MKRFNKNVLEIENRHDAMGLFILLNSRAVVILQPKSNNVLFGFSFRTLQSELEENLLETLQNMYSRLFPILKSIHTGLSDIFSTGNSSIFKDLFIESPPITPCINEE